MKKNKLGLILVSKWGIMFATLMAMIESGIDHHKRGFETTTQSFLA